MFDGIDYQELAEALGVPKEVAEADDTFKCIAPYMDKEHLPLFVSFLEAHLAHLKAHDFSNHSDYIPVYELLLVLAKDEANDYFSFFQLFGVMYPLMWC